MILLPIIAAWFFVVLVVAGLCSAARAGDAQEQAAQPTPLLWELPQPVIVAARGGEETGLGKSQRSGSLARTAA
jgi:hypothetical protein